MTEKSNSKKEIDDKEIPLELDEIASPLTEPSAEIIADSISEDGHRLTTMKVTMHRFVLPEFNTHRAFSRNSASSRAIPVEKQIGEILGDPAWPVEYGSNKPGMQAGESISEDDSLVADQIWNEAKEFAIDYALQLHVLGVHKQIVNRLIEPFMWHTTIVSATEWENFFEQRCSPLAQPEIRVLAEAMRKVYRESEPKMVNPEGWHLPYIMGDDHDLDIEDQKKVSVARCARVSYLTHDGQRDPQKDIDLFQKLVSAEPPHWSPLEHVARPVSTKDIAPPGNFDWWMQLRHDLKDS